VDRIWRINTFTAYRKEEKKYKILVSNFGVINFRVFFTVVLRSFIHPDFYGHGVLS